jgi:hypothetical protein
VTPEEENVFRFHPAETQEVRDKHQHIRKTMRDATAEILSIIPERNRERSQFFSAMDDAMKYANACVARNSPVVVQPSALPVKPLSKAERAKKA